MTSPSAIATRSTLWGDGLLAAAGALAMTAFHAARGFPTLADSNGDNDSVLRLVQVRDLMDGQGWFDPFQYRMGLEGGFAMHWSRLVDLPIAVLIAIFGETAALVIWPLLLSGVCLFLILRAARAIGGPEAVLPALVVGGIALYFVGVFPPGALDHHNVQLALTLAALVALIGARAPARAGLCAALMLAIGMEAAPYAAIACATAALLFLAGGEDGARTARRFGAGFAATCLAAFLLTIPAHRWLETACDAFSFPQTALGALGGAGLALSAFPPALRRSLARRLAALGLVAASCALLALTAFPQCLADPYATLDPRLRTYWLSAVVEAQSFIDILRSNPAGLAASYSTPLVALSVLAWWAIRRRFDRNAAIVTAFLATAFFVSLWQVRGSVFSLPLAAIPLAAWIGHLRSRVEKHASFAAQLAMVAAWLASVNLVWHLAMTPFASPTPEGTAEAAKPQCYAHADYDLLATLPPGTVAAISNLGSSILLNTQHRVLAGPYHRNQQGNIANLDLLMGDEDSAKAVASRLSIDYLLHCPGNPETRAIAGWAPDGLLANIEAGEVPGWLEIVPESAGQALQVWRRAGH